MQRLLRYLLPLALLVAMLALAACGGDDNGGGGDTGGEPVATDASASEILEKTFSGGDDKKIDSGVFSLNLDLEVTGDESLQGPITLSLGGPFQSEGEGKLPQFDIDLSGEAMGQSIEAGLTSTGDKGFIALKLPQDSEVTEYAVSDEIFQQFKSGFEQAQSQAGEGGGMTFADLGINPQDWLTDPQVEGDSEVDGTETVKITGGVDVAKFLADINTAIQEAGPSLGAVAGQAGLPEQLTEEQIAQVQEAVKDVSVEIETGKDDSILRRMAVTLNAEDPAGSGGTAAVDFEITLSGLNEDQEISEPSDTQPFEELLPKLGGLGGLGALAGGGGSTGGSGGVSSDAAEEYTQCIADAGSDVQAAQECASLLGG